jgi:YbbR domain-containing protein
LVQNGEKLIPSVTRVFSKGRSLYVYLQAYEQASATAQPLMGYVSFYQGQTKVYETQPVEVSPSPSAKVETAPLNFTVDLSQLPPGKYDCQVTVLDPTGAKGAFWQAPILLVP